MVLVRFLNDYLMGHMVFCWVDFCGICRIAWKCFNFGLVDFWGLFFYFYIFLIIIADIASILDWLVIGASFCIFISIFYKTWNVLDF